MGRDRVKASKNDFNKTNDERQDVRGRSNRYVPILQEGMEEMCQKNKEEVVLRQKTEEAM